MAHTDFAHPDYSRWSVYGGHRVSIASYHFPISFSNE